MKKTFSNKKFVKKSGFSLIELSIVLIIIGLLIAGITGGASLIKSSELRSAMGEARGYAVAVNSFFTQFDQYPGDTAIRVGSNSGREGDKNNQIEFTNSSGVNEGLDAWYDLKDIGAIDLSFTAPTAWPTSTGTYMQALSPITHFPGSKIKSAGWLFDYQSTATPSAAQNVVVLTGTTTIVSSGKTGLVSKTGAGVTDNLSSVSLSGPDSLSIDAKVDDGLPNSGNVRGINKAAAAGSAGSCTSSDSIISGSAGTYVVSSGATKSCVLTFRVDVSS